MLPAWCQFVSNITHSSLNCTVGGCTTSAESHHGSRSAVHKIQVQHHPEIYLWFVWQLHAASSFGASLWQWATSNGHGFLRRRGDDILRRHATSLSNYSICKIALLANLQLFQPPPRTPFPWEEVTKDVKMTRLGPGNWPLPFNLGGDRSETDFQHSGFCWEVKLVCCEQLWGLVQGFRVGSITVLLCRLCWLCILILWMSKPLDFK